MFIGRESELATLERLYGRRDFQMAVVYGRRRVGKTTMLDEFAKGKPALYFTAQQKSTSLNLRSFSQAAYQYFGMPATTGSFESWSAALSFIASEVEKSGKRLLFVFDEFPYAAEAEPSLPSTLQIAIDHELKGANLCMVLCGSNEGFMESEVLGRKSPLFGRRTAQIRLRAFDYADATRMLGVSNTEDAMRYYASFGGTPYYLAQVDPSASFEENVTNLFFSISGILYAETSMLLRQELREPALYASALDAIAAGATTPKTVAERAGISANAVGKYLSTLSGLGIVRRIVPFGENEKRSRKGAYRIDDPYFAYWHRFVSPYAGAIESGAGEAVARQVAFGDAFSAFVGLQFETVCRQWLTRQNRDGKLPFLATSFGSWWGTDPDLREQVDIDVIAANKQNKEAIFAECKWRNRFDESEAIAALEHRSRILGGYEKRHYILFMKGSPSTGTAEKARQRSDLDVVTAQQIFFP